MKVKPMNCISALIKKKPQRHILPLLLGEDTVRRWQSVDQKQVSPDTESLGVAFSLQSQDHSTQTMVILIVYRLNLCDVSSIPLWTVSDFLLCILQDFSQALPPHHRLLAPVSILLLVVSDEFMYKCLGKGSNSSHRSDHAQSLTTRPPGNSNYFFNDIIFNEFKCK